MISRYEFEVLSHIAETGKAGDNLRELADGLCLSAGTVERALEALIIEKYDERLYQKAS